MNQPENKPESFGESTTDEQIREILRAMPFPDLPSGLEQRVRYRVRQRPRRRLVLAGSITATVLLAGLLVWQPRMGATRLGRPTVSRPVTSQPVTSQPVTSQPVTSQPATSQPATSQPISQSLPQPKSPDSSTEMRAAATLNAGELDALFALPPVDPLGVLDRRQKMAFTVLEHAE